MPASVWIRIDRQECEPCRAQARCRNFVSRIRVKYCDRFCWILRIWNLMTGKRIMRYRTTCQVTTEIANLFSRSGNLPSQRYPSIFVAPLLRPKEEDLILPDWTADISPKIVVLQLPFWLSCLIKKEVICI